MQKDMHYYGTYMLARAAGMKAGAAHVVASASQFVDDSVEYDIVFDADGSSISTTVTAHDVECLKNFEKYDQHYTWVPFHFLPGGDGEKMNEKMVCVRDSRIAKEMLSRVLLDIVNNGKDALTRIGITAHVYADTFSHYGFSGISSDLNRVITSSIDFEAVSDDMRKYIKGKNKKFFRKYRIETSFIARIIDRITGGAAESISKALGHGPVATCPDRPYLNWSFKYEKPERKTKRNNPATFIEGCAALHAFFKQCCDAVPLIKDNDGEKFESIKDRVSEIIVFEGTENERIGKWKNYVRGKYAVTDGAGSGIPEYKGEIWKRAGSKHNSSSKLSDNERNEAISFHRSAEEHQRFVLKELLPKFGMSIV